MGVEQHSITSREQWLGLRKSDITASIAGALLGVHEFTTPYALWCLKSGRIEEDPEESAPMRRGRLLEPVAVQLMRELRPTWKIERGGIYLRDPDSRIGATPDVFVEDPDRGPGIVQIKSVEAMTFRKKWRDSETGDIRPPLWVAVQGIVEAHLAKQSHGAQWVGVAPMVVSHGLEMPIIDDIPIHGGVIDRLKLETAKFWNRVEKGEAPPADYGRDGEIIAQLYGLTTEETVDLSADNALPIILAEDKALAETMANSKKRRDAIKAEVIEKMGHAKLATCTGWRISAPTVNRKAYSVPASSYRQVRATPVE
jgi:predicted phage-related endonuclease